MRQIEEQVFMDPIYGNIRVKYEVILKLINSSSFQRLRRIKQLSSVSMIYHGAEHSRFSHSLGAYFVANKFLNNYSLRESLSEREQLLFITAALLHDIGHGPYSHSFENAFHTNHEQLAARIILENQEIKEVLDTVDNEFKIDLANIILKQGKYLIIEQLISSQLDVDRIDYLLRDAYYTGAPYGNIDLDRLVRVLVIKDNKVTFKETGLHTIESYLINRYHMYFQVYFHRVCRAHEAVLENIYLRVKDLLDENYQFKSDVSLLKELIENQVINISNYLKMDDFYMNGLILSFRNEEDKILKTLANDYLNRNIWNYIDYKETLVKTIESKMTKEEIKYYTKVNTAYGQTYAPENSLGDRIYILLSDQTISTLNAQSPVIRSLSKSGIKKDKKYFYR